jgi:hypothetical protein
MTSNQTLERTADRRDNFQSMLCYHYTTIERAIVGSRSALSR